MSLYCFFSRDDQYVPLCKVCNTSIYVIVRLRSRANETDIGKMICSNAKCKKKLLQEFSVDLGDNDSLSRIKSKVKN